MREETRRKVKQLILSFAESIADVPYTVEELKKAYPFHAIFFPGEALKSFKQQRSIVTKMGMTLYPNLAEIIAKDHYSDVYRNYEITGMLSSVKVSVCDRIIDNLRSGRRAPDHNKEIKEIHEATGGKAITIRTFADLYVGDFKPGPLFLEIKSPLPNLDVCAESKKKMLYFLALYENKHPEAYLAFPYNPYIYRHKYVHGFTKQVMDLENEVLIGEEMWDKLGGRGTYEEILGLIEEVTKIRSIRVRKSLNEW